MSSEKKQTGKKGGKKIGRQGKSPAHNRYVAGHQSDKNRMRRESKRHKNDKAPVHHPPRIRIPRIVGYVGTIDGMFPIPKKLRAA